MVYYKFVVVYGNWLDIVNGVMLCGVWCVGNGGSGGGGEAEEVHTLL